MIEMKLMTFDCGRQIAFGVVVEDGLRPAVRWPADADAAVVAQALHALAWKMEKKDASQ